ncbi:MAG: xylose isomerase [Planctomycetes bacterium]|nr:xylose isomerase [Planctomycetota bacterium]
MMSDPHAFPQRFQSICRWSFHAGKGGFVPSDARPGFRDLTTHGFVRLVAEKIAPRVPENTRLGVAVHYNREVDEKGAERFAETLSDTGLCLSMISPGAHPYFGYGGLGSPDPQERARAEAFSRNALELMTGPLADCGDPACPMVFDIWNGSFGYEIPSIVVKEMLEHADAAIGRLLEYACSLDRPVKFGIEPKPNEGHAAMLYQTSAEVLALRSRLKERGLDVTHFGLINEFGHTEMAGLDLVQEYAAAALENAIVHVHANSQGGDGIRLGGSGKFDIDYGVAPNASTLAAAHLLKECGYSGWIEHDMQPRPYDDEAQNIDRVVRSICNWEAMVRTVETVEGLHRDLCALAAARRMMEFEDLVRDTVQAAHTLSKELYGASR